MSAVDALASIRGAPDVEGYLERVELRLEQAVDRRGGLVGEAGRDTLTAGGKRLRPVLVYLCAPPERRGADAVVAAGAAVELVHMATLVHDDLLDGAELRRGQPTTWATHGERAAKATGDHLFARAFSLLAGTGDARAVRILADASLALARGEALQRRQAFQPDTPVEDVLTRCSLKTGTLFEAACLLGRGREEVAAFGLSLGVAFQIVDDILDCAGEFDTTGKAPGLDLRDGTPTVPLILAAREDEQVRRALAGADVPDALERVAQTGALAAARKLALDYITRARAALDGEPDRPALDALALAVVNRQH